jgi:hypothetical protein
MSGMLLFSLLIVPGLARRECVVVPPMQFLAWQPCQSGFWNPAFDVAERP